MAIQYKKFRLSIGLLWLIESFILTGAAHAQESNARVLKYTKISELGIGIGGMNYQGDIATEYKFRNNRPALTVFYRKVVSQPLTLKVGLAAGMSYANDSIYSDRPFQLLRGAEIKSKLVELGFGIEYYFLDYYDFRRFYRWSPYFFTGPNIYYYSTERSSNLQNSFDESGTGDGLGASLTMGAGIKFSINRSWNFGLEFGPRLILSQDLFDDLTETTNTGAQMSNPNDKDWYFYNGISISYTFYKTYCPSIYKNNTDFIFD